MIDLNFLLKKQQKKNFNNFNIGHHNIGYQTKWKKGKKKSAAYISQNFNTGASLEQDCITIIIIIIISYMLVSVHNSGGAAWWHSAHRQEEIRVHNQRHCAGSESANEGP